MRRRWRSRRHRGDGPRGSASAPIAGVLPVVALVAFVAVVGAVAVAAGPLLGYDFQAYVQAADRLLAGEPLYDPAVDVAGGFAIYLYPPPFAARVRPVRAPAGTRRRLGLDRAARRGGRRPRRS